MKHKLSRAILAIAVIASLSVPSFAADCRTPVRTDCGFDLLRQLVLQFGGSCGTKTDGEQIEWNDLLAAILSQYRTTQPETPMQPETPAQPETPTQPETPAQPEIPAQPTTPAADSSVRAYEREVVRLVNIERAKYGLAALKEDEELSRIAQLKSKDMHDRGYFDHTSPTYGTPFQMMKSFGVSYRTAGENIAMGYRTPEAVVSAWMNSPGHRANILNASYTTIGVGYVADGSYWTQHFIG